MVSAKKKTTATKKGVGAGKLAVNSETVVAQIFAINVKPSGRLTLAEFTLSRGAWVIQASGVAGVSNDANPGHIGVKGHLMAEAQGVTSEQFTEISADKFSTMITVLGIQAAHPIRVRYIVLNLSPKEVLFGFTTVTAVKQKKIIALQF